jgi:hypothetical protein
LSSDTEDYCEVSKNNLNSDALHKNKWRNSMKKSVKTYNSFKEKGNNRHSVVDRIHKEVKRSNSSTRILEDSFIGSALHRSLKKKKIKKRGNLENLEGECYISFQRLLSNELRKMDMKDAQLFDLHMRQSTSNLELGATKQKANSALIKKKSDNEEREKTEIDSRRFNETLWLFGKRIGKTKGIFKVKLGHSIHQMGIGLMTENGIKFNTSLILDNPRASKVKEMGSMFIKTKEIADLPEGFKELTKLKNELFRLEAGKNRRSLKGLQERERILKLIVENLNMNVGSKSNNVYVNEFSLIRAQDLFLVLLLH